MKRIVTLQDLSCAGKCSISVALPVLSCLGIETVAIPTALLSNHTAFESFVSYDLSDKISKISSGLENNNFRFDAIYTGYMGSKEQIDEILKFIDRFHRPGVLLVVDPAMADDGVIYSGLTNDFPSHMKELVAKANVIIPNITEACMLLGRYYKDPEKIGDEEISEMLVNLSDLGPGKVIITGVHQGPERIGAACFDRKEAKFAASYGSKHHGTYLGTGDIFASMVAGCLLAGQELDTAMSNAVDFISHCIAATEADPDKRWYGVSFERCLHLLPNYIG